MMKNYLLKLLEQCSDEKFGQDAVEWAVVSGGVPLTYDLDQDVRTCMSRYDEIIEGYRASLAQGIARPSERRAPMQRATSRRRTKAAGQAAVNKNKRAA